MKFVMLINLKLLTIANSFLLNLVEHENFSANKYENANNSTVVIQYVNMYQQSGFNKYSDWLTIRGLIARL